MSDANADEIEVTPEMIEAGEDAVLLRIGGLSDLFAVRDVAIAVYRAMSATKRRHALIQSRAAKTSATIAKAEGAP
ncbi:MAG: hypothetical protein U1E23_14865 [Reyranellaceae bacterium]